jgi:hypothetical protein
MGCRRGPGSYRFVAGRHFVSFSWLTCAQSIYDGRVTLRMFGVFLIFSSCLRLLSAGQVKIAWDPHPVGAPVSTAITYGDAYTTPVEIYDARISVTALLRGEKAWDLLRKENASNRQPEPGFEFVLARIRFEFTARGKPGDKDYAVKENQFVAFESDGAKQYPPANAVTPSPGLGRVLRSGESSEGWVAFIVARNDRKPFMVFQADVRVLSHSGMGPAFRLY